MQTLLGISFPLLNNLFSINHQNIMPRSKQNLTTFVNSDKQDNKMMNTDESNQRILGIDRQYMAILLMISGSTLNTLGYVYVNERKFHPITTNMIRGITTTVFTYLIARKQGIDLTFPSAHNYKWQNFRNAAMMITTLVYAWSQFYLPLPIAITLMSTSPIFASIFDKLIYGVNLNKIQVFWLSVAFIGVLLTSNGNYLSYLLTGKSATENSSFQNYFSSDPFALLTAALILLVIVCLHGFTVVLTKILKNTDTIQINYSQGVLYTFVNAVLLPFGWSDATYHNPTMWQVGQSIVFMGIPITMGLSAYVLALLLTKNYGTLTPFMFTSIIFGYLVSIFRYGEDVNVICLIGAVAIVVGIVFNVKNKEKT